MNAHSDARRSKVTEEHRQEAELLRALWSRRQELATKQGERLTQNGVAQRHGISQSAVTNVLQARMPLSMKLARILAQELHVPIGAFSPRLQRELELLTKPAEAAIGPGTPGRTLANEFDRLPEVFPDGGTKEQFLQQLLGQIWQRPHMKSPTPTAPIVAPSQQRHLASQKQPDKVRGR